jgi:hypothetical protein
MSGREGSRERVLFSNFVQTHVFRTFYGTQRPLARPFAHYVNKIDFQNAEKFY